MLDEPLRPVTGAQDLVQTLAGGTAGRHFLVQQIGVAQDDGQNVVEVMRNAPGERAECAVFLGLVKLRLERGPRARRLEFMAYIRCRTPVTQEMTGLIEERPAADRQDAGFAMLVGALRRGRREIPVARSWRGGF